MLLWAAIDLMGGSAVTLTQGREADRTLWKQDPVQLAARWESEGADGLHVVDLDAALEKGSDNREVIVEMSRRAGIPVQVGGGIRTESKAREWLDDTKARVVIGTMAYTDPGVLRSLLKEYGEERVVVAADYRDGEIVTRGWKEGQGVSVVKAVDDLERYGVVNVLTTSVGDDGMRSGPDVEMVRSLSGSHRRLRIIASGGVRDSDDLLRLREAGAVGAVIGRALYEGTVELREAKRSLR